MGKDFHCSNLHRNCTDFSQSSYRKSIKNNKVYVFYDVSIIYISKYSLSPGVLLAKIYKFLDQLLMVLILLKLLYETLFRNTRSAYSHAKFTVILAAELDKVILKF